MKRIARFFQGLASFLEAFSQELDDIVRQDELREFVERSSEEERLTGLAECPVTIFR